MPVSILSIEDTYAGGDEYASPTDAPTAPSRDDRVLTPIEQGTIMKRVKRVAIAGLACVIVASSTLLIASPAHAEQTDSCRRLQILAIYYDNMTMVYRGAFGADYFRTREAERSADQAWSLWVGSCI
jgi:hypothetical protein